MLKFLWGFIFALTLREWGRHTILHEGFGFSSQLDRF